MVVIVPRHRPCWPAPGVYYEEAPKRFKGLGSETNPLPVLLPAGKAISAATIRVGLGWLEIPFVATLVIFPSSTLASWLAHGCKLSWGSK